MTAMKELKKPKLREIMTKKKKAMTLKKEKGLHSK